MNNAYTGRVTASGKYDKLRYSVNSYLTSLESSRLQPQNRYGVDLRYDDWARLQAGHVYPMMSKFTISGRRVLGINTEVHALQDKLNLQFIWGELEREITNRYGSLLIEEETTSGGWVSGGHLVHAYLR